MPHISINFSTGATVYWHDDEQDAVLRGHVVEIRANSSNAGRYSGDFAITYVVQGKEAVFTFPEEHLHDSPTFPPILVEPPSPPAEPS